jgi:hypothetical protein
MWYTLSISARCSSRTPFVFVGLVGGHRRSRIDEILVSKVVGHVAVADQHDVAEREVGTDVGDVAGEVIGEHGVDEDHFGT